MKNIQLVLEKYVFCSFLVALSVVASDYPMAFLLSGKSFVRWYNYTEHMHCTTLEPLNLNRDTKKTIVCIRVFAHNNVGDLFANIPTHLLICCQFVGVQVKYYQKVINVLDINDIKTMITI